MRRWTIEVSLRSISDAQQELAEHLETLGVQARASFVIVLVYEEVARNLFDHAANGQAGMFDVHLEHAVTATTITIEDNFVPFDPTKVEPEPATESLEEHSGHGLGLRLLTDMTDELRYERVGSRNRLSATVHHR